MYDSHRFTMACRCARDSAVELSAGVSSGVFSCGKKDGERSDGVVDLKSDGVTSDTNHGINFGLIGQELSDYAHTRKWVPYLLEYYFRDIGSVGDQEVREDEVSEELSKAKGVSTRVSEIFVYPTSNPAINISR